MAEAHRRTDDRFQGWAGAVQETAEGAAQKASEGAAYVQDRLGAVDDTVRGYTGKPLGEWADDLTGFIRERPLLGAAMLIGVGLAVARLLRR
jgi:hypothetical protein